MTFPLWFGSRANGGDGRDAESRPRPRLVHAEPEGEIQESPADEIPLLARLRAGDEKALRVIIDAHGPALLALAAAVTGSAELGDDVVQRVFIRLWDHRETLVVQGPLRKYLWRAARNQAISVRRHEQLQHRTANAAQWPGLAPHVARNVGEQELDAASFISQVTMALQALPARCREIFLLSWRDALTPLEISDALGIGIATVRNQILRAVKHLGAHFGYR